MAKEMSFLGRLGASLGMGANGATQSKGKSKGKGDGPQRTGRGPAAPQYSGPRPQVTGQPRATGMPQRTAAPIAGSMADRRSRAQPSVKPVVYAAILLDASPSCEGEPKAEMLNFMRTGLVPALSSPAVEYWAQVGVFNTTAHWVTAPAPLEELGPVSWVNDGTTFYAPVYDLLDHTMRPESLGEVGSTMVVLVSDGQSYDPDAWRMRLAEAERNPLFHASERWAIAVNEANKHPEMLAELAAFCGGDASKVIEIRDASQLGAALATATREAGTRTAYRATQCSPVSRRGRASDAQPQRTASPTSGMSLRDSMAARRSQAPSAAQAVRRPAAPPRGPRSIGDMADGTVGVGPTNAPPPRPGSVVAPPNMPSGMTLVGARQSRAPRASKSPSGHVSVSGPSQPSAGQGRGMSVADMAKARRTQQGR